MISCSKSASPPKWSSKAAAWPGSGLASAMGGRTSRSAPSNSWALIGLGEVGIHAGGQTALAVALHRMGRQRDHGQRASRGRVGCPARFQGAEGGGGLEAAHLGHLHVH